MPGLCLFGGDISFLVSWQFYRRVSRPDNEGAIAIANFMTKSVPTTPDLLEWPFIGKEPCLRCNGLGTYQVLIVLHIAQNFLKTIPFTFACGKDEIWFVYEDGSHGLKVLGGERPVLKAEKGNQDIPASIIGRTTVIRDHFKAIKKLPLPRKVEWKIMNFTQSISEAVFLLVLNCLIPSFGTFSWLIFKMKIIYFKYNILTVSWNAVLFLLNNKFPAYLSFNWKETDFEPDSSWQSGMVRLWQ